MSIRGWHRHEERPAFQDLSKEGLEEPSVVQTCAHAHLDKPFLYDVKEHAIPKYRETLFRTLLPPRDRGGARRDRTDDLLLAKQALSQLSYGPDSPPRIAAEMVGLGRFELPTSPLSGVRSNRLSYRPAQLPRLMPGKQERYGPSAVHASEKKEKRRRRSPPSGTRVEKTRPHCSKPL
jgi:hypothetical protein